MAERSRSRVRSSRARAGSTLAWALGLFLVLQLGLTATIETCWPALRDPHYGYKVARLRQRTLLAAERPLTVVMLGSSRTTFGFRGACIEEELTRRAGRPVVVFNFGILGAGPVTELLELRRLLAEGVRPDLLLVEVMPPFLSARPELREASRRPINADCLWRREVPLVGGYWECTAQLRAAWWQSSLVPWYSHRFTILSRLAPD
jgi:hypothetical protein